MSLPSSADARASGGLSIWAPAKVNWYLEVLGKREDGYHEIITFMVAVDWCDRLSVVPGDERGIRLEIRYSSADRGGEWKGTNLSTGRENLVLRAAELLCQTTGCSDTARLVLEKRIPIGAGLGGGSSDAAATLLLLNSYWRLGLSHSDLENLAGQLGSDVPFFLDGAAAWCHGRGEVVKPWPMGKSWWLVLVVPPWTVSTAKVYAHVRVPSPPQSPDCFQKALMEDNGAALARAMFNRLEEAALSAYPELQRVHDSVREVAADSVHLSGSGGTFFVLASSRSEAEALADKISATLIARGMKDVQVHVAATLTADRLRDYRTPRPVDADLSGEGTGAPVNCP